MGKEGVVSPEFIKTAIFLLKRRASYKKGTLSYILVDRIHIIGSRIRAKNHLSKPFCTQFFSKNPHNEPRKKMTADVSVLH